MADGKITIATELDTKSFDAQIEELEDKLQDLEKQKIYFEAKGMKGELKDVEVEIEKTQNKLVGLYKQKQKLNEPNGLDGLSNSFEKAVKKAGKLALGIFGIRSAYMALRRASSDLAGYDEQYATNLEYIRFVLTQAIAPVLRGIVQLAMKLLQIVAMIVRALFGVNIFSKASVEDFQKMKKGAGGVEKAVKGIKKQLMGFDEVNVLSSQTDSGAGGGGISTPDMDLSKAFGEMPKWLEDIAPIIWGIVGAIIALKAGLDGIKALGIGIIVYGIVELIRSVISYLQDPTWANFGKVIRNIGIILTGLALVIESIPVAIAGAIVVITGLIIENWEKIKKFFQNGIDYLKGLTGIITDIFGEGVGAIWELFVSALQDILNAFDSFFSGIKKIFDGIIEFVKGVFTGDWEKAWSGVQKIFSGIWEAIFGTIKNVLSAVLKLAVTIASTVALLIWNVIKGAINAVLGAIETILNVPIKAINGLIDAVNSIPGVSLGKLKTFKLPRLAVGGIVNMPNKRSNAWWSGSRRVTEQRVLFL